MENKAEIILRACLVLYLIWLGIVDYHKKIVPWKGIILGFAGAFAWIAWECRGGNMQTIISCAAGAGLGGLFLGTALVSKGKLGCGDGLLIIILGLFLGIEELVLLLFLAFMMAAVEAAGLILKKRRNTILIPLVPFIAVAYGICTVWKIIGG